MREIIFATGNENKMREIREIFEGLPFVIHSLKEVGLVSDPEENGATFAENAFIKAGAVHALRPDAIVMSDDSGLSVDYLNGEPGVFSARWLGRDTSYTEKNAELIRRLEGVEGDARSARFTAAIACILPDGTRLLTEAHMEGRIAKAPAGENGFGYDPIFYLREYDMTSAQLSEDLKNKISHRAKALKKLSLLKEFKDNR